MSYVVRINLGELEGDTFQCNEKSQSSSNTGFTYEEACAWAQEFLDFFHSRGLEHLIHILAVEGWHMEDKIGFRCFRARNEYIGAMGGKLPESFIHDMKACQAGWPWDEKRWEQQKNREECVRCL